MGFPDQSVVCVQKLKSDVQSRETEIGQLVQDINAANRDIGVLKFFVDVFFFINNIIHLLTHPLRFSLR